MTVRTLNRILLPNDLITDIASYLTSSELANFRLVCRLFNDIASDACILQPLYNRLYALDKTLPPILTKGSAIVEFNQAIEKIKTEQNKKIILLNKNMQLVCANDGIEFPADALIKPGKTIKQLEEINFLLNLIFLEDRTATENELRSKFDSLYNNLRNLPNRSEEPATYLPSFANQSVKDELMLDENQETKRKRDDNDQDGPDHKKLKPNNHSSPN